MIEALFELLFELFGELLLQLLLQTLAQVGIHLWNNNDGDHALSANQLLLGYVLLGFAAGGLSLWIFPEAFARGAVTRIASLVLTPPISGAVMVALARLRKREGQVVVGGSRFLYGFFFALAMALVRYRWAG